MKLFVKFVFLSTIGETTVPQLGDANVPGPCLNSFVLLDFSRTESRMVFVKILKHLPLICTDSEPLQFCILKLGGNVAFG